MTSKMWLNVVKIRPNMAATLLASSQQDNVLTGYLAPFFLSRPRLCRCDFAHALIMSLLSFVRACSSGYSRLYTFSDVMWGWHVTSGRSRITAGPTSQTAAQQWSGAGPSSLFARLPSVPHQCDDPLVTRVKFSRYLSGQSVFVLW